MKKQFTFLFVLLCAVLVTCSASFSAFGASNGNCSLTLDYTDSDAGALDGAAFRIYCIADGGANEYEMTEAFKEKRASVEAIDRNNAEDAEEFAEALAEFIAENDIAPEMSGSTDKDGKLSFTGLSDGLYLVLGDDLTKNGVIFTAQPILLWLPCADPDGGIDYDPVCSPKHYKTPESVPVDITVEKIWVDDGDHPSLVTVQLLRDGEVFDEVTLNEQNSWKYIWEKLESEHDWQITEINIPEGYTASVTRNGAAFTVTNTQKLPQTGQLWWPVPILLGSGVVLLTVGLICRKHGKKLSSAGGETGSEK